MCKGMSGGGSRTSSLTLGQSKSEEPEVRCLSPSTPLSFSKFSIETEWGEMEDFEDVAGGPLCYNGYNDNNASSQSWFDIRVMYVRVTGCSVSEEVPESLSMRFPPRSIGIAFEVNGGWISPSEEACVVLKRDRVDSENAEATFVSTDNLRMSGTVCFEVFNKEEALVSGTLELSDKMWSMECRCVVGKSGCAFFKGRHDLLSPPAMEVSMVGRHLDTPVFITQTVHLIARRKMSRILTLDVIPETEELGKSPNGMIPVGSPQLGQERDSYKDFDKSFPIMDLGDKLAAGLGYGLDGSLYAIEGEDGQMTWFNAGVRVGVGIGLGMCLGAGIGIGLMIRTYQATTRTLRKVI